MDTIDGYFFLLLRIAGPICFMGMQLAALTTAVEIMRLKTVGQLSPIPFLSLMTNSAVWTLYGYLKMDSTVLIPNFTGLVAGLICTSIFHTFATNVEKRIYIISASIISLSLFLSSISDYEKLGYLGVLLAIFLMGSPLSTLRTVLRDKSTEALPFWTSLTTFGNSLSWFLYGVIDSHDPMIYIPNFVGLLLSLIQLSLFGLYGFPKPIKASLYPYSEISESATDTKVVFT